MLCPWMRLIVSFFEALRGDVRVNLCGGKTGVAKECLNAAQVRAGVEHVSRETVPELVRGDINRNARRREIAPH